MANNFPEPFDNFTTADLENCSLPRRPGTQFDTIAYGFIYPVLAAIVIVTNSNGVCVLMRMDNFTQTNTLLLAIFIVDMLTTVFPLPKFLTTFTINGNQPMLPRYPWCFLDSLSAPIMPTITNNISIWLVALLSMQRCLCVRNRELYERVFSQTKIVISIVLISVLTFGFHLTLFLDKIRGPASCRLLPQDSTGPSDGEIISVCSHDALITPSDPMVETIYLTTYYVLRVVIFHVIPIITISISTVLLIHLLFRAQSTIDRLYKQDKSGQPPSASEKITSELARIEENEYRNASVHLSERRQRTLTNHLLKSSSKRQQKPLLSGSLTGIKRIEARDKKTRISTTTHMLVIISTIYLIQHIFQSSLFVTGLVFNFSDAGHTESSLEALAISATMGNLAYLAGFPATFFLCVFVQEPFRAMFYSIYVDSICVRLIHRHRKNDTPATSLTKPVSPIAQNNRPPATPASTSAEPLKEDQAE